jgi:predicted nucleic acid-binding protein
VSTTFLVDNSVLQRLHRSDEVRAARDALISAGELAVCLPTVLEACFSARNHDEHQQEADAFLSAWKVLEPVPDLTSLAVSLQGKLFAAGKGRAVGVSDLHIAATALYYGSDAQPVVIVHYDADFDHLVSVEPALRTRWIVPRGTVA